MLTQDQLDSYDRNGYLSVENVLPAETIDALRQVTGEFVEKSRQVISHDEIFDLEPGHSPENPRVRRLKSPASVHPIYKQTLNDARILDLVAQLIGPAIRYNGDKLNIKSAEGGSPVEWHQDITFYPHTNDDLLAVGVAIDDMNLENGCLMVIPGSHKGPLYDHHQEGVFVGAVTDPTFEPRNAVPVQVKAGGISIHHTRLLHGSAPNTSEKPRRLLLFQYCAVDAWPLLGVSGWDTFNSYILRGEPTQQPRLSDIPVRIPLPEPELVGSIYEIQTALERPRFAKEDR